jgi:hypothetical protein
MALTLPARRARLVALRDLIDAQGGGALHVFAAPQPAVGAPALGPPLLIMALGPVSFELDPAEAQMVATATGHVAISGLPAWVRFVSGAGAPVLDLPAGLPGTGAAVVITDGQDPPSLQLWTGGEATATVTLTEAP